MQGYDVVTSDDHKIGHIVEERDECLIVEHGHVFKAKHAIPKTFAHADDTAKVVRATITKDVFTGSPKVTDDWNCTPVLEYYGVIPQFDVDPDPDEPGTTTDADATQARAEQREGTADANAAP
jgi:hypothetical protein